MSVTLKINGETRTLDADPESPLLWALRDELGMTGTKFGCGIASCGACTVHWDGMPIRSCQTMVGDLEGAEITTIEGVNGKAAKAVQEAWNELDVPQCGYCQSGQIMAATALLTDTQNRPTKTSTQPWTGTSAAVRPTPGSARQSMPQPTRWRPKPCCISSKNLLKPQSRAAGHS
jgi:isoquinoline 1-oxidoreductase alpha subunit